jgi:methionine sulfoxide reductase heme-binding subunit
MNTPITLSRGLLWLFLSLPAIAFAVGGITGNLSPHAALHPSGEMSARLMIITMLASPLRTVLPKARWVSWLMRRRRDLGVAAFAYAVLHTAFYLIDLGTLTAVVAELGQVAIWTGWLACLIMLPLALTSNDAAVRRMGGRRWKALHRWVYPAAILTVAHWAFIVGGIAAVTAHFLPLALLLAWRWHRQRRSAVAPAGSPTPVLKQGQA